MGDFENEGGGLMKVFGETAAGVVIPLQVAADGAMVLGGSGLPVSVTFSRPANTTAYHAKDVLGVNLAVSGATNASPIVMTTATHGLADGDYVTQASVGGNTNANGSFYVKVTGYSPTTYALYSDKALTTPVAGNSNYTSGGTVARLFRLPGIFRKLGGSGYLVKVRLMTDLVTFLDQIRIHIYSKPVAATLDHGLFTLLWANRVSRLGYIDLPVCATEGSGSDAAAAIATPNTAASNLPLFVQNTETVPDDDLWFVPEDLGTGTPASAQNFYIEFTVENN
jgi:hypothetical protein